MLSHSDESSHPHSIKYEQAHAEVTTLNRIVIKMLGLGEDSGHNLAIYPYPSLQFGRLASSYHISSFS